MSVAPHPNGARTGRTHRKRPHPRILGHGRGRAGLPPMPCCPWASPQASRVPRNTCLCQGNRLTHVASTSTMRVQPRRLGVNAGFARHGLPLAIASLPPPQPSRNRLLRLGELAMSPETGNRASCIAIAAQGHAAYRPANRSSWPGRFSWEGSDGEADASAGREVSEARAGTRPVTSEGRRSC